MNHISITSPEPVVEYLVKTLADHLSAGERVTWLVPGGSSIAIAAKVSQQLVADNVPLDKLSVTLTDERYGELGHADENWVQLEAAGFTLPGATLYRVVQADLDRETTTERFAEVLEKFLTESDYRLGFFGIGADGHTAGIKPHAFEMDETVYAASFAGADFERITMTPFAIATLSEAVVYAVGEEKAPALRQLFHETLPTEDQPAQALKTAEACTVFTDVTID